jgi:hypothetical protein
MSINTPTQETTTKTHNMFNNIYDIYDDFIAQLMNQMEIIVASNYFQYHYNYYKGTEELAMGPPISALLVETYYTSMHLFTENITFKMCTYVIK